MVLPCAATHCHRPGDYVPVPYFFNVDIHKKHQTGVTI